MKDGEKVAFLVGSGVTAPAVPGTSAFVERVRKSFADDSDDQAELEQVLHSAISSDLYRAAARFAVARRGGEKLNDLVRQSVLTAFRSKGDLQGFSEEVLQKIEFSTDKWNLTEGVLALGKLLTSACGINWGPVLTTNFDPLIEVSVRRAGGQAFSVILPRDGDPQIMCAPGVVSVVHLHGYWLRGDTLHTDEQLAHDRPQLANWLSEVLSEHHLIIIGYGAWDDSFTRCLRKALEQGRARQVCFCLYQSSDAIPASLDNELRKFSGSAHVAFYAGIDAHRVLPDWAASIDSGRTSSSPTSPARQRDATSPIDHWELVDANFLKLHAGTSSKEQLLGYFDGRWPSWGDVVSGYVPERDAVSRIVGLIQGFSDSKQRSRLLLLRGASGEGKSTILHQVAVSFSRQEQWSVLWRTPLGALPKNLSVLPRREGKAWILISDDADRIAPELNASLAALNVSGRSDVHFLAATRDTDWAHVTRHYGLSWEASPIENVGIRGLEKRDAQKIVNAWSVFGDDGLGALAKDESVEGRVETLLRAARLEEVNSRARGLSDEGAFLGAMLRVRYGIALREHVRSLLVKLRQRHIDPKRTLLDGFYIIAALHSENLLCLVPELLAAALGVSRHDVISTVVTPLGQEALAAPAGDIILVRHRAIAEAAMDLASDFHVEPAEVFENIVSAAFRIKDAVFIPSFADLAYISTKRFSDRPSLALATARVAFKADPLNLAYATNYLKALRGVENYEQANAAVHRVCGVWNRVDDYSRDHFGRGFLCEWAALESRQDEFGRSVLLCLFSVSDVSWSIQLTEKNALVAFVIIGNALDRWIAGNSSKVLGLGLLTVTAVIRLLLSPEDRSKDEWLRRLEDVAAAHEADVRNVNVGLLHELALEAEKNMTESLPFFLGTAEDLSFESLQSVLGWDSASTIEN